MFKKYRSKALSFPRRCLPYLTVILSFLCFNPYDAQAYWTLDADAGVRSSDNVTNGSSAAGKKSDTTGLANLSAGTFYVVGADTSISLGADLKSGTNFNYGGLNKLSTGIFYRVGQRFGLGPEAVRLSVYATGSHDSYVDTSRNSLSYRAGLGLSRWFGEIVKLGVAYEYDKREQLYGKETFCVGAYYCYAGDVWSTAGNSGLLTADFIVTEKDLLTLSYRHRNGDVTSEDVYSPGPTAVAGAYAPDRTFGGLYAYRLSAATDSVSLGVSHEVLRKMSLNFDYTFYNTTAGGGTSYQGNVFNLLLAYSM